MKIEGYTQYGTMVAAEVPNNSIFRDVADNLMKSKDNAGVITELITTGGGDVSKVGTPEFNQLGIWTGDGTLKGDLGLKVLTGQFATTLYIGTDNSGNSGTINIYGDSSQAGGNIFLYNGTSADDIHEAYVIRAQSGKLEIKAWNDEIITYTSLTDHFNIASSTVQFSSYGSGTIIGTPTYGLGVDVSGNVIETALPSVSKTGTPALDQLAVWAGDGTLAGNGNLTMVGNELRVGSDSINTQAYVQIFGDNTSSGGTLFLYNGLSAQSLVSLYVLRGINGNFELVAQNTNVIRYTPATTTTGVLSINHPTKISAGYTVATLPTGAVGQRAYVTDATAPTYLGTLTGGGAITCPVFHNGTEWVSN